MFEGTHSLSGSILIIINIYDIRNDDGGSARHGGFTCKFNEHNR